LKQEKEVLSKEVDELSKEKNDYVQKKMLLKQEREELDSRENYIKTKYEEAGLSY
jgi:FtsZ-binding cell division protein ZapB